MATLEQIKALGGYVTPTPQTTAQTVADGVSPMKLATTPQDSTDYSNIINTQIASIPQLQQDVKQKETQTQNSTDMLKSLLMGQASVPTANADQSVIDAQQNVDKYNTQQAQIQAQASALQRQAQIIPLQAQQGAAGQGITDRGLAPLRTAQLRDNAIQSLALAQQSDINQAALMGSQISLDNARNRAQQIVDLKYKGYETAIAVERMNLLQNQSTLERIDKKLYDATVQANKKEEQQIAEKKANDLAVGKLIIEASPYAPSSILNQAKKLQAEGRSSVEVAIALGKYGGDYMGDLVKRSSIQSNEANIRQSDSVIRKNNAEYEKTIKEIKMLGQAPRINAPVGTNANFVQNLAASAVNKESLGQSERTAVTKNLTVLDQLDSLQANIAKQNKTGFITGKVNNVMAAIGQNADVGTINAQLQAIVPNLARGVYGEVGVLTDNDIENYRKTLPTLTMPKDQNDAVLALTLKVVQKNLKNTLETAANSKMDVSRFAPQYQQVTNKINEINDRIGVSKQEVLEYGRNNPQAQQMITELSASGMPYSQILQVLGVEN